MSFKICSYNLGNSDGEDFRQSHNLKKEENNPYYDTIQQEAEKSAVKLLLNNNIEVFLLQEVHDLNRIFIKTLEENKYEIHTFSGLTKPDCAIALKKEIFDKNIVNISFKDQQSASDIAVVTATHIKTGKKVDFVSTHVPGFSLENPTWEGAIWGQLNCSAIVNKLNTTLNKSDIQIIGADMNSTPDTMNGAQKETKENQEDSFTILNNADFTIHRTSNTTNIKSDSETLKDRELDYIFTRTQKKVQTCFERIFHFFFGGKLLARVAHLGS